MDWIILIGLAAAVLTTSSFVPQIVKIIKTKGTKDISLLMYAVITIGFFLWLVYGILRKDPAIIFANVIALILGLFILLLKVKYK